MGLTDKIKGTWGTISSATKKIVSSYGLPVAMATTGLYAGGCGPPERGNFGNDGGGGGSGGNSQLVLADATKILSGTREVVSISEDRGTLQFLTYSKYAQNLREGDVIVAGIHDKTPYGLLRKVTSITNPQGYIEVKTEQATLEDAIKEGTLEGRITFTESLQQPLRSDGTETREYPLEVDVKGSGNINLALDEKEIADGVYLGGNINIGIGGEFKIDIRYFSLQEMFVKFDLNQTARLEGRLHYETDIDAEKRFNPFTLNGTEIDFGGFPLVVTPMFEITPYATTKGRLDAQAVVTEELTASVGLEYDKNSGEGWEPTKDFNLSFGYEEPTFEGCGYGEIGTRVLVGATLYGVAGPYVGLQGSLKAEAAEGEPSTLMTRLKASIGAKVSVLGRDLVDVELRVYNKEKKLWEGPIICQDDPNMPNDGPNCSSDAYRRCAMQEGRGVLYHYNSCDQFETKTTCEHGCDREGKECSSCSDNRTYYIRCENGSVIHFNDCDQVVKTVECESGCTVGGCCQPNHVRHCTEEGNLAQYNSCGILENIIECERGCSRAGNECWENCISNMRRVCLNGEILQYNSCNEFEGRIGCPDGCMDGASECGECVPNSSHLCENGNLSQYDSCDQLERVIECENGCERGARVCNAPVGEGEGEGEGEQGHPSIERVGYETSNIRHENPIRNWVDLDIRVTVRDLPNDYSIDVFTWVGHCYPRRLDLRTFEGSCPDLRYAVNGDGRCEAMVYLLDEQGRLLWVLHGEDDTRYCLDWE